jgi:hypothetical protein
MVTWDQPRVLGRPASSRRPVIREFKFTELVDSRGTTIDPIKLLAENRDLKEEVEDLQRKNRALVFTSSLLLRRNTK